MPSFVDSLHPRLLGRSGGQVQYGGIAANEDYTCRGTSHGTKDTSNIILQDDGGAVVLGHTAANVTTAPLSPRLQVRGRNAASMVGWFEDSTAAVIHGIYAQSSGTPQAAQGTVTNHPIRRFSNSGTAGDFEYLGNVGLGFANGGYFDFGTSAVGCLGWYNGTAPTTSPANIVQMWAQDTIAGQSNLYTRNENGKIEQWTGLKDMVSTQFDRTSSTTLTNITGLSHSLEVRRYAFRVVLWCSSNVAGGIKFAMNSGVLVPTEIKYTCEVLDLSTGALVVPGTYHATALGTTVGNITAITSAKVTIEGEINEGTGGGALNVQFGQNFSNGSASSVLVGSYFEMIPIGD